MKKKITIITMAIAMAITFFSGCGQKEIDIQKVKEDIIAECDLQEMRDATEDEVGMLYDFGDAEYDEIVFSISQNSVNADQITIVKAKSEDDVDSIKEVIEQQLESREKIFEGYAPDEAAKFKENQVKVNGKYIFAAVCNDNNKAENIFDNAFKD